MYFFARDIVGRWPAVAAAIIVTFSSPLVARSTEAWFYSEFVLWFLLALMYLHRGYRQPGLEARLQAVLAFTAAMFTHEFAVVFVPIALVGDIVSRVRTRSSPTTKQLLVFWPLIAGVTLIILMMSLALRAPTLGGSTNEIRGYIQPHLALRSLSLTSALVRRWHPWLLPAAALGLAAMLSPTAASRRGSLAFVALALVASMTFVDFVLGRAGHERDQLMLIPALVVLGVAGAQLAGPWIIRALGVGKLMPGSNQKLAAGLVSLFVIANVNPVQYWSDMRQRTVPATWVQNMTGFSSDDLVMTYGPTVTSNYLGRTDFWLRSTDFAKYVWGGRPPYHDIHSNAVLIRSFADFESLVLAPNIGRTMWVVWRTSETVDPTSTPNEVLSALEPRVLFKKTSPDGNVVLKVQL